MGNVFKVGDCVELKSGGPTMTVKHIADGIVSVVWFEDLIEGWGGVRVDSFPEETLELEVDTTYEMGG